MSTTTENFNQLDVTNEKSLNLPIEQKENIKEVTPINCPQQFNVIEKTSCSNEATALLKIKTSLENKNQKLETKLHKSQYKLMALEKKLAN